MGTDFTTDTRPEFTILILIVLGCYLLVANRSKIFTFIRDMVKGKQNSSHLDPSSVEEVKNSTFKNESNESRMIAKVFVILMVFFVIDHFVSEKFPNKKPGESLSGKYEEELSLAPKSDNGEISDLSGLTKDEVQDVIRTNLNQIRHCYEAKLKRDPGTRGQMSVSFTIDTDGSIQRARIQMSEINDSVMRGCVANRVRQWRFPKPRGGKTVTVTYPFVFNPD